MKRRGDGRRHASPSADGRKMVAHGASPGNIGTPTPPQPRKGRKKSRPNVTFVVSNAVLPQKGDEFLLEGHAAVMLLLLVNISHHGRRQGLADAEHSVAGLPVEAGIVPAAVHPARGIGFQHPQSVGRRYRGR